MSLPGWIKRNNRLYQGDFDGVNATIMLFNTPNTDPARNAKWILTSNVLSAAVIIGADGDDITIIMEEARYTLARTVNELLTTIHRCGLVIR